MRGRYDDLIADGATIRRYLKLQSEAKTLGGAVTMTNDDGVLQAFDAGGSSRNVTLPVRALVNDGIVRLFANLSTAGENLVIKDAAASTILTVPSGGIGLVVATGTAEAPETRGWAVAQLGGEDFSTADDVAVGGDLAVTGATTLNGNANVGNAAADLVGFYAGTGISQRASSNQASTNAAVSASFGATQLAILQEIMNTLTLLGLWKGAA